MTEKEEKTIIEESVSKVEYDKVVAERDKYLAAINKLINAMAQRYAQDLYKEVLGE